MATLVAHLFFLPAVWRQPFVHLFCLPAAWRRAFVAGSIVIKNWLNRGLWDANTHRALPALAELKALRAGDATISDVTTPTQPTAIYSLSGQYMGNTPQSLPQGFYIAGHKKWVVR